MNRPHSIPQRLNILMWITFALAAFSLAAPLGCLAAAKPLVAQPMVKPLPATPSAQATFDYKALTSLKANPTIRGSASSSAPLLFKVLDIAGTVVYQDSSLALDGGRFAETIYPPISNGLYKVSIASGARDIASTTLTVGLHTLLKVEPDMSLGPSDVTDGHLMRFKLTADPRGGAAVGQFAFSVVPSNVDVEDIQLFGYSDDSFTTSLTGDGSPLSSTTVNLTPTSSVVTIVPDELVEIPPGRTYYFDLVATATALDSAYDVDTTLLGDTNPHISTFNGLAPSSSLVWSPNTYGTSTEADLDWLNGSIVSGLPAVGLETVRANPPPTNMPSCMVTASTSTAPAGTPVTLTWSTSNAVSALWETGTKADMSGSKTYTLGSSTHTYILSVASPYGQSTCFATVAVPGTSYTATTTAPTDGFTATPTTGPISLSVTFAGSVNNNKVCSAQTFTLGYGDGTASSTISVPANSCKAVAFSFVHSYTKVGTSTAGLYRSTGTTTSQRIQTQVIVAKAKVAFGGSSSMMANALSAVGSGFHSWLDSLLKFFAW